MFPRFLHAVADNRDILIPGPLGIVSECMRKLRKHQQIHRVGSTRITLYNVRRIRLCNQSVESGRNTAAYDAKQILAPRRIMRSPSSSRRRFSGNLDNMTKFSGRESQSLLREEVFPDFIMAIGPTRTTYERSRGCGRKPANSTFVSREISWKKPLLTSGKISHVLCMSEPITKANRASCTMFHCITRPTREKSTQKLARHCKQTRLLLLLLLNIGLEATGLFGGNNWPRSRLSFGLHHLSRMDSKGKREKLTRWHLLRAFAPLETEWECRFYRM